MPGTEIFKLIDNQYLKDDYIKSADEINAETEAKIRQRYSACDEIKLLRIGDRTSQEFIDYNNFVEQCRMEGRAQKAANATEIATLTEIEIGEEMKTKIFVRQ